MGQASVSGDQAKGWTVEQKQTVRCPAHLTKEFQVGDHAERTPSLTGKENSCGPTERGRAGVTGRNHGGRKWRNPEQERRAEGGPDRLPHLRSQALSSTKLVR
jgi:hypothetical protein